MGIIKETLKEYRQERKKQNKGKIKKAWIIGNIISFEKPTFKSAVFDTEEVEVRFK